MISFILAHFFDWFKYDFMRMSLLALVFVAPTFGLTGTMVVSNRMAFFSDVIGHSALTGLAIGVLFGLGDPLIVMILFAAVLAILINIFMRSTHASNDTVIGVFFAATIALGVAILGRGGSFGKYTIYLTGDIFGVTPHEIILLGIMFTVTTLFWIFFGNYLALVSVNPSIAHGRRITPFMIQCAFSVLIAILVILSIRWVGILIINSLFILPAASARIFARTLRSYTLLSVVFALVSGFAGVIISFYSGTSGGATIVLVSAALYGGSIVVVKGARTLRNGKQS